MASIILTRSEVSQHASKTSCWIIINSTVFDVTEFVDSHPGGSKLILNYAGRDATEPFEQMHAAGTLEKYLGPEQTLGFIDPKDPIQETGATVVQSKKPRLSSVLSIPNFELSASKILPPRSFAFFKSGAEDEYASNWNIDSWKAVRLRPRVLRPVATVDTRSSLFGTQFSAPIFICPAGGAKLANKAGDVLLTKAAAKHNVLHWVCNNAGCSMQEVAESRAENQTLYWQIYAKTDLQDSAHEIKEAIRLGFKGFALTVDAVRAGSRERDLRASLAEQQQDTDDDAEDDEAVDFSNGQTVKRPPVWTDFDWLSAVAWLRELTDLPIAIKGIQCWEDAAMCLQFDNVHPWLSNHGGRQIDASPSAVDTLIEIQKHCPELCKQREVIVDGGVTRGADVVKALALGARAVGLGRPFLFSLVFGEAGVSKAIRILRDEFETTMALLGVTSVDQLNPSYIDTSRLEKGVVYLKARL